jgi:hypothetical protein
MDRARDNAYGRVIRWFKSSLNRLYNWDL